MNVPAIAWSAIARPPIVTLPLLATDSALKGSNLRACGWSVCDCCLSGGCGASGVAATVPPASTALITDSHVLMYARLMKILLDLQADRVASLSVGRHRVRRSIVNELRGRGATETRNDHHRDAHLCTGRRRARPGGPRLERLRAGMAAGAGNG